MSRNDDAIADDTIEQARQYVVAPSGGNETDQTAVLNSSSSRDEPAWEQELDAKVAHYELIRLLGRGGMGEVHLARDTRLGRLVAIKWLATNRDVCSPRFTAEARATAQLHHENIVVIHEIGEHKRRPYMVLEYIEGQTLGEWLNHRRRRLELARGPDGAQSDSAGLPPGHAIELMIPVVRAVAHAHERGIVHRDLKPSNIMLGDSGTIKVLDFGIAKFVDRSGESEWPEDGGAETSEPAGETRTGHRVGTDMYMAPEQWRSEEVDHLADIWALGMLLAELVLGRHLLAPVTRDKLLAVRSLDDPMPSLAEMRPDVGKLGRLIDRCLLKHKDDRLGSARKLLAELGALQGAHQPGWAALEQAPYPGLAAFQEEDAARFFGRTRLIAQAVMRLAEQPLLAVVGPSGVGKSSFVRAGVIPALKRTGDTWETYILRPGPRPMAALAELLMHQASFTYSLTGNTPGSRPTLAGGGAIKEDRTDVVARLGAEPGTLGTLLRSQARRKLVRIALFVDQFEELYTLAPQPERDEFLACMAGIADDAASPLRVVLAMRSDFLHYLAESQAAFNELTRGLMLLPAMERAGLHEALVRPLEPVDHRFESEALVEAMLDSLETTPGALPLLQFTAAHLWEQRDREQRVLTHASYRRLGGVAGILARHADHVLGTMTPQEIRLTRAVFLRLVTPERTRALATVAELRELSADPEDIDRVLGRLLEARLLMVESSSDRDQEGTVEIVHESLLEQWPILAQWLTDHQEDAAFLDRLRHAAAEWQTAGQSAGLLWRGQTEREARIWYESYTSQLAMREERYLQAVFGLAEKAQRTRRQVFAGVVAALALVAITMSYLFWQQRQASLAAERASAAAKEQALRAEEQTARARDATRMAKAKEYESDPTLSLALLREIESPTPPPGWSELVRKALRGPVAPIVVSHPNALVRVVKYSPDGRRIVAASGDAAWIWRSDGEGESVALRGHQGKVLSGAFSPDGTRVVTSSMDNTARVWNADGSGEPVILAGHTRRVVLAVFSPDGRRILTTSDDKTARVWSADGSGTPLVYRGHAERVFGGAFSPDGALIATGSVDNTLHIWPADGTGEALVRRGHTAPINALEFSPDGQLIVTGSNDTTARVWRTDGRGEPIVLRGHTSPIYKLDFSPNGKYIVTASPDTTARLWRADGWGHSRVIARQAAGLSGVAFSPDGKYVVTGSEDKTARFWNADGRGQTIALDEHDGSVRSVVFSPDGTRVATASLDNTARLWSADGSGKPTILAGHTDGVHSAAFSPDGARVATGSKDKTVRIWNADGSGRPIVLTGHESTVLSVAFSPDGERLVTASEDRTARIWRLDGTGGPIILTGHTEPISAAAFSPDGTRVVTASEDRTARIWNADGSGEPITLTGHTNVIMSAAYSPDGSRIVTSSHDRTARIWNADGSGEPITLTGHSRAVTWAAFSSDGQRIITSSLDMTARIWNADGSGEPIILSGHAGALWSAAFSPDGMRVVTGSLDNTARIWSYIHPIELGSDELWRATNYCMPTATRMLILGVNQETAERNRSTCLRKVAEHAR